jgi:GR25 family glycosyltransferase involved in LPS biosynthesis
MDNIDRFFVINLDKREDRLKEFYDECQKYDLDMSKYERFPAVYRPNMTTVGCTLSHAEVLKIAKNRGYKNIIIFEDDFMFTVDKDYFYQKLKEFFDMKISFGVLMLEYSTFDKNVINDLVSYTTTASGAAGYIVNHTMYDELINCLTYGAEMLEKTGEHWNYINDQIWKRLQGERWLIFNKRIGEQRPSFSDLKNVFVTRHDYN